VKEPYEINPAGAAFVAAKIIPKAMAVVYWIVTRAILSWR
jgi:hypothetical protein